MENDWHANTGKPPRDKDAVIEIRWGNGQPARHTYTVGQIKRWTREGLEFDVAFYRRAEKDA